MRLAYILYLVCLLGGIAMLLTVAYAIPRRLKSKFPDEFEQLRDVSAHASLAERRGIVLRTGDPALQLCVRLQHAGYYIWATGMIVFTGVLLIWD